MSIAQINRRHQLAPACGAWRRRDVMAPFGPFVGTRRLVGRIGRAARGSSTQAAPVLLGHDLIHCFAKKRFEVFLYSCLALYFGCWRVGAAGTVQVGAAIPLVAGHRRGLRRAVCRAGRRAAPGATR